MRDINLAFVLGSDINYRELIDLVDVVDGVDWSEVPLSQALRGTRRVDSLPSRTGNGGDLVWYDSYTSSFIDARTAGDLSHTSPPYEDDLPAGFVFIIDDNIVRICSALPVPVVVAPVVPDVPIVPAPVPVVVRIWNVIFRLFVPYSNRLVYL